MVQNNLVTMINLSALNLFSFFLFFLFLVGRGDAGQLEVTGLQQGIVEKVSAKQRGR